MTELFVALTHLYHILRSGKQPPLVSLSYKGWERTGVFSPYWRPAPVPVNNGAVGQSLIETANWGNC